MSLRVTRQYFDVLESGTGKLRVSRQYIDVLGATNVSSYDEYSNADHIRVPNPYSPEEVRRCFEQLIFRTDVLIQGDEGETLTGTRADAMAVWDTHTTETFTRLSVDNLLFDGDDITSNTGQVDFHDDNIVTTGVIQGVNVTSGSDPGHTHTGASLFNVDHGTNLVGLGDDDHTQYHNDTRGDARYYRENEHVSTSAGAGDAGKPIILDAGGQVDATMINDGDIDHGLIGGLTDDDHTQYFLVDGTRALSAYVDFPEITVPANPTVNRIRIFAVEDADFTVLETITDLGIVNRINQDSFRIARNKSGVSIAAAKAVYFSGSTGNKPNFSLAKSNAEATMPSIGLTTAAVANNAFGKIMVTGRLTNVKTDLAGWTEGAQLYVDPATAGELTHVRPVHPNIAQWVGTIEIIHATAGAILVLSQAITGVESGTNRNTYTIGDSAAGDKTLTFDGAADGTIVWGGTVFTISGGVTTAGTVAAGTVTGINVTSGADPGHTHGGLYYTETELDAGQLDNRYFTESEHINTSAGAGSAGKPIKLDADGEIAANMLGKAAAGTDHGTLTGLADDDHTQYLLADGTRTLTNNMAVTALKTIDGRDLSVDGSKLDGIEAGADVTDAANVALAGAAMSGGAFHDGFSDFASDEHVAHAGVTLTAGSGLAGGGTIAASRTFDLDINELTTEAIAAGDFVPFWDITAVATNKKILFSSFESTLNHDNLAGFVAAEHLSLPGTIANVLSDHTLVAHTTLGLQETITANTTYYIATTGSDVTGDGSAGTPWATLAKALLYLSTRLIASGVTVTITIGDGTYTWTTADTIAHPNGDKINIVGTNTYSKTLSSIQSSSGAAGAWAIILNVDSVANIAVNDFCLVPYNVSGGTRPETLCGCWIVTNVDAVNTRITVTSTHVYTSAPSGAVAGTITIIKTILYYNGVNGIVLTNRNNLGLLNKLVLLGNGTSYGISLNTGASLTTGTSVGISAFAYGVLCQSHSHIEADQLRISNCATFAARVYYATMRSAFSVFSGNTASGVSVAASKCEFSTSVCSGNGTTGFGASGSTHAGIYAGKSTYNTLFGFYVESNSFIDARTSVATGSGTTYSPAIDTVGNVQAFIWFT